MERILEVFETHNELNPKLWNEFSLKPEVREKILKIVDVFYEKSNIEFKILDILLVGSNASYNYTSTSDIDVHIVVDFNSLESRADIVDAFFNLDKSKFNNDYDISIYGLEVEVYVEDVNASDISNGIFSVKRNKWIKKPIFITAEEADISVELNEYTVKIQDAIASNNKNEIDNLIDEIHLMRKDSLSAEGEFGKGNQLFKELRSRGLIQQLKDAKKDLVTKELTLEELINSTNISRLFKTDFID